MVCVHAKSPLSCPALCDPVACSPPGSFVSGILQARILELLCPPAETLPDPGIKPMSLTSSILAGSFFIYYICYIILFMYYIYYT